MTSKLEDKYAGGGGGGEEDSDVILYHDQQALSELLYGAQI